MSESLAPPSAATLGAALADTAIETFERLAYFFTEPRGPGAAPGEPAQETQVDGVVGVTFDGPSRGGVVLQLSGDVLSAMAANMLGVDGHPSPADQTDALGEAVNVICGNVLPRVAGTSAVFTIGAPVHFPSWNAALTAIGPPSAVARLTVEGGRADLAISVADIRE